MSLDEKQVGEMLFKMLYILIKEGNDLTEKLGEASQSEVYGLISNLDGNHGKRDAVIEIADKLGLNLDDYGASVIEGTGVSKGERLSG
jgi:hypothetical protein